jgi:hypothetical protein
MTSADPAPGRIDFALTAILRIARDVAGGRMALREALTRSRYREQRPRFSAEDVRAALSAHPVLVDEWLAYSEDKRTEGGWYVLRDGEIGEVLKPASQRSYPTIEEAVAQFILHELDYWADQNPPG